MAVSRNAQPKQEAAQPVLPTEDSRDTFPNAFTLRPLSKEAPLTKTRRVLPHWEQAGCTYFVTFRLADAVAAPIWK